MTVDRREVLKVDWLGPLHNSHDAGSVVSS